MDEPTIGLDVTSKYALRKFVKEINERRETTIILTTHDLGDIEQLCSRLIIINHGRLVEDGNLEAIVERIAPFKTLAVEYYDERIPSHDLCELTETAGNVARYRFRKQDITAARLIEELGAKAQIKDVAIEDVKIEDIIQIAYGE